MKLSVSMRRARDWIDGPGSVPLQQLPLSFVHVTAVNGVVHHFSHARPAVTRLAR